MNLPPRPLDPAFLAGQRQRLIDARLSLSESIRRREDENCLIGQSAQNQASETEDGAQDLTSEDNGRALVATLLAQRVGIDRALAKIDDGTYGLSDLSGETIPRAQLEASPESVQTVAEAKPRAKHAPR